MSSKIRSSIFKKRYLALFALIISIIIVSGGTYLFKKYEKIIRTDRENELHAISDLKSEQIAEWKRERTSDAIYYSQSRLMWPDFEKWINNSPDKPTLKQITEKLKLTRESHKYVDIQLLSAKGDILFTFNNEKKYDEQIAPFIKQCINQKDITYTDLYYCKIHKAVHYDILAPLVNDKKEVFGVIIFRIDPHVYLYPLIQTWPTPSRTAETLILRKDGENVVYLNDLRHWDSSALRLKFPLSKTELPAVQAVSGKEGIFEGIDYRGVEVLSDIRKLPNTDWYMVTKIDNDEVFKELNIIYLLITIFVVSIILLVVAGVAFIYNYRQKGIYRELYNSEKKFYQAQEEFKTTLYSIGDAVITTDLKGNVMHINPVAESLTGWKEKKAQGKPLPEVFRIINEETRLSVESPVEKVLKEGMVIGLANHTVLISKDGRETPIADSGAPIKDEDGVITGVVLVFRDQTEERNNRKKVEESEKKFKSLFDSTNEGICLHELILDKGGEPIDYRILDVNSKYEEILHLDKNNIIGKKATEIYQTDSAPYLDLYSKVALTGKTEMFETYYPPMEKHFSISVYSPSKGKFATVFQDITERKTIEESLKDSEARLNAFMEYVPALILIKDEQLRPIYANNKFKELFPYDDWHLKTPHEAFEKEIADEIFIKDNEALNKGFVEYEEEWKNKSGNVNLYYTQKFRIDIKGGGRLLGGIITDITEWKKAEKLLIDSEKRFSQAFISNPSAMAISRLNEGIILNINESYEKLMGYTFEDFKEKSVLDLRIYEDNNLRKELISELKENGFVKDRRINFCTKNRKLINTILSMEKLELDGEDCILSTIIDITEIERNEKLKGLQYNIANAVINSRNLHELFDIVSKELNSLIDTTNFFAALYDEETDMLFTPFEKGKEASVEKWKAEKSLTGIVIKQKMSLLLNKEQIRKLSDEGKIKLIGSRAESWLGVPLKIGNKIFGAIVIQDYNRANAYDEKSIVVLEMIAHELSIYIDRKKAEGVANRLTKGIEQSPICIVVTDKDGTIEYVNPKFTEVTGYTSKEAVGNNPRVLKSGEQCNEFYKNMWQTILSGKDWQGELHNKKKNGELYWESAIISPILDEGNNITHFIALKEDITEKKKMIGDLISAKEKAEEMNRLKSSFLANMSHELRTPLNGILGFAEILKDDLKDDEQKNMAQIIFRSGKRLHNTLNQILDLTTLESSVSKVDKENIDVNTVVEESYQLYKADASKKNLELILDSRIEDMILFTDRNILLNTINNLLDNAIKYTHEGSVTLRLLEEKTDGIDYAVIEVTDTGIGIEKENMELIFDEFRQVSEGYGRSFEGTGLGLSICKKYMNLLGGQIKLSSELYRGSTFRIELPKISNEAYALPQKNVQSADETQISESNIKRRKYNDKILYVENDIDNQTLVEIVFKNYVQVDIANDAIEGIKMSKENDYSIILMDINLGSGMNGNDVTRVIRKNPKYKEIPIVAVTAFAMEGDRDEFIESGCTHYLSKPFEVDVMQKLIFGLLEKNG